MTTKLQEDLGSEQNEGQHTPYEVDEFHQKVQIELIKLMQASTLDFIRSIGQILQALTAALLTVYVSVLVNFGNSDNFDVPWYIYSVPVALLTLSMIVAFINVYRYKGTTYTLESYPSTIDAYEAIVNARRRHLLWPSILTFLGIIALGVMAVYLIT
ncbi:MAG TPA: hypothetical protein VGE04_13140 [Chloroflexia bacterium]|jgi:hypothetical protein